MGMARTCAARSRGKLIMAIVGHPRFAGGRDTTIGDEKFAALYRLLVRNGVTVTMAGDTHDFKYYQESTAAGGTTQHHFVNGGGGAYLSIGTALGFPASPAVPNVAFYPSAHLYAPSLRPKRQSGSNPFGIGSSGSTLGPSPSKACQAPSISIARRSFRASWRYEFEGSNNRVASRPPRRRWTPALA